MQNILENKEDKLNYLKGLIRLSISNGDVPDEQKNFFANAALGMQLDENDLEELDKCWIAAEKIKIAFSSKMVALFFIQEAIQICMVDGIYDAIEQQEIYQVGNELAISSDEVGQLESWVKEGIEWKNRGEQLIKELSERE